MAIYELLFLYANTSLNVWHFLPLTFLYTGFNIEQRFQSTVCINKSSQSNKLLLLHLNSPINTDQINGLLTSCKNCHCHFFMLNSFETLISSIYCQINSKVQIPRFVTYTLIILDSQYQFAQRRTRRFTYVCELPQLKNLVFFANLRTPLHNWYCTSK